MNEIKKSLISNDYKYKENGDDIIVTLPCSLSRLKIVFCQKKSKPVVIIHYQLLLFVYFLLLALSFFKLSDSPSITSSIMAGLVFCGLFNLHISVIEFYKLKEIIKKSKEIL